MILKIKFGDNDFADQMVKAGDYLLENYTLKDISEIPFSQIKNQIVICAYAEHLKRSSFFYEGNPENLLNETNSTLKYLYKIVEIEEVKKIPTVWENSEVCFVDFYTGNSYCF